MNVTQIISDTNIGGGGKALLNYLSHCNRAEFVPSVILPQNSALTPFIQELEIPLLEISAMADQSFDKKAYKPLQEGLKQFKPDLIHTHGSLIGRIVGKKEKCKVLYTKHCAFPPSGLKATPFGKTLVGTLDKTLADGVIAVGHSAEENLLSSGIKKNRIFTMYNGVTPLNPLSPQERDELRTSYGFSPTDFVIGILARVETYKGHEILLQATKQLLEKNLPVKLLIAGDGSDLPHIRELAQTFPENTVHFTGFISEVEKPLSAMDIQVNASIASETSCLSLLEGMSLSLPAVASDVGGNPHLIRHGLNGLIFQNKNVKALADALTRCYDDKILYQSLKEGSKTLFFQEFTGEQYAKNIENVYRSLKERN